MVAYESRNQITNTGSNAWRPETGLLSIWLLGMYPPSDETVVVIPIHEGPEKELGPKVNDSYFGKIPDNHIQVTEKFIFFKGDGSRRGKIGVSAKRSRGIIGSYDAAGKTLHLVTYNQQEAPHGYVNSMWEMQEKPYDGDVINSYNDGSPEPGKPPLGPFYEIETSSPAAALEPGQAIIHTQRTIHLHGSEKDLNRISQKTLGLGLDEIKASLSGPGKD